MRPSSISLNIVRSVSGWCEVFVPCAKPTYGTSQTHNCVCLAAYTEAREERQLRLHLADMFFSSEWHVGRVKQDLSNGRVSLSKYRSSEDS